MSRSAVAVKVIEIFSRPVSREMLLTCRLLLC